jgi:hypothetical protein
MINDSQLMFPSDGRDYFEEVIGKNGFKKNFDLSSLIQMIPAFISDFADDSDQPHEVIGKFHLNQVYDLNDWPQEQRFSVLEQSEISCTKFNLREIVLTPGMILMFKSEIETTFVKLQAWVSYASIVRIKRNNKDSRLISIIFKVSEERQPWVLNLVIQNH